MRPNGKQDTEAHMNRWRFLTAAALAAALVTGGTALAQGGRPGGPGGRMGGPGLMLRGLNLTDAQEEQVREIRQRHREEASQAAGRVREAMAAQRKAVQAIPLNEGQIRATTFALAEAQTEAAIQQARVNSEIWSLLTDQQRETLRQRQSEREARPQRGERQRQR